MADPGGIHPTMSAEELRQSWQGLALSFAARQPQLKAALLSLMADNFDETMPFLLAAVYGDARVYTPFYSSNPKIDKAGHIVADMVYRDGITLKDAVIFLSEQQMQDVFRKLADRLKLSDADRVDLFVAVRHWVKADMRLDPTMDRRDPDAKRLTVH